MKRNTFISLISLIHYVASFSHINFPISKSSSKTLSSDSLSDLHFEIGWPRVKNTYRIINRAIPLTSLYASTRFKNFDEMLCTYEEPLLVNFHAKWCGPCQSLQKELGTVREELGEKLRVFKVDTEKFPSLGSKYNIEGLPTVLLFIGGEPVHRIVGLETADEILRQVKEFM